MVFSTIFRPAKDGYAGLAQKVQYNGVKKAHGNNHQGLETQGGIVIEMSTSCEGITHDQRMLRESRLLECALQYCALSVLVGASHALIMFYLFADRGTRMAALRWRSRIRGKT